MISIIVPVYNAEKYIENCILSVINQTFQNWQLILINDGSTDSSIEICEKFRDIDHRIHVFSQVNKGQAAARNFGLKQVTTQYVAFLDADDEFAKDTLEANMKVLMNDASIDALQFPVFMNYSSPDQYIRKQQQQIITNDFYKAWLIKKQISWVVWDKIYKKEIFDFISFKEGIVYEDNLMILHLMDRFKKVYISEEGMYFYFLRENSTVTSANTLKKEKDSFYVTSEIAKTLYEKKENMLLLDFLVRLINIKKSLKHNFSTTVKIDKKLLNAVSNKFVVDPSISLKDKVKLLLEKCAN